MSYIPDCRTDECYNQKYLNEKDKDYIGGYDYCVDPTVSTFFDNLDFMDGEVQAIFEKEVRKDLQKEGIRTVGDYVRIKLFEWIEMERDELRTAMIDEMNDDEYDAIKEKVDGQDR